MTTGTEVATVFTKRPEYALVKQEASSLTKSLTGGSGYQGKRLSIKGGVFRLLSDGKEVASIEDRHLDVVMVRAAEHVGRTYFSQAFSEDSPSAPDCWSADGTKPDATSSNKQAETCAVCPQNIKGSGNEDSRACRFSQRVAVVLANDIEGDVLQVNLPATSLFGKEEGDQRPLQAYARFMAANNANIEQFITRLRFDVKAATPKLFFKAMRWLTAEEYEIAKEKGLSDAAVKATTMSVSQTATAPVAPGAPLPAAAPKAVAAPAAPKPAAPAVVGEEPPAPAPKQRKKAAAAAAPAAAPADAEPPIAEPKLRPGPAPAPAMPPRTSVAAIASQWDVDD